MLCGFERNGHQHGFWSVLGAEPLLMNLVAFKLCLVTGTSNRQGLITKVFVPSPKAILRKPAVRVGGD